MIKELIEGDRLLEALLFEQLVSELGDPFTVPAGCEDLGFVYPASSLPEELPGVQELKERLTGSIVDRYGTGSWELIEAQKQLADTLYRLMRDAPVEGEVLDGYEVGLKLPGKRPGKRKASGAGKNS